MYIPLATKEIVNSSALSPEFKILKWSFPELAMLTVNPTGRVLLYKKTLAGFLFSVF